MSEWPLDELERLASDWRAIDAPGPAPETIRRYVRTRSVALDLRILAWTVRRLSGRGAN